MDIKTEITTGEQYSEAYAAKDVNALQLLYNSVSVVGLVPLSDLDAYLRSTMNTPEDSLPIYWVLKTAVATGTQPQASLAMSVLDLFNSRLNNLDFSLPITQANLAACVTAGLLSTEARDTLIAFATKPRTATIEEIASALYLTDGTPI